MIENVRGFLLDLDGTLMTGQTLLPGSTELLRALGRRCIVVSNDSEHTPAQLGRFLRRKGVAIEEDRLVLSGMVALDILRQSHPAVRLQLIGSAALRHVARRLGFDLTDGTAEVVLIARDRRFNYRTLAAAVRNVQDGADVVLAAPDLSHPGQDGYPVPEAGALAAAILSIARPRDLLVVGKPEPTLFQIACTRLKLHPAECVMIGDNPLTDGEGAGRSGMSFVQVAPGDLVALARTATSALAE